MKMSSRDLTEKLSPQEREKCLEIFNMFVRNKKDGFGVKELQEVMSDYRMTPNAYEVKELIDEIDSTGSEFVNFDTFLEAFLRKLKDSEAEEELREAFKVFDKDGNGFISTDDLKVAITELGEGISLEEFNEMLNELDIENNQQIDIEELITILTSAQKSK